MSVERILYTAEAVVEGGRNGRGRTSDGRLEVSLSVPIELGGDGGPGTNPEQLFAVGYGASFESALLEQRAAGVSMLRTCVSPQRCALARQETVASRSQFRSSCMLRICQRKKPRNSCSVHMSAAHIRTRRAAISRSISRSMASV